MLYPPPPIGDSAVVAVGSQSGVLEESNSVSEVGEETPGKVRFLTFGAIGIYLIFSVLNSAKVGDASA